MDPQTHVTDDNDDDDDDDEEIQLLFRNIIYNVHLFYPPFKNCIFYVFVLDHTKV